MSRRSGSLNQCYFCEEHFGGARAYGRHFDLSSGDCLTPDPMRAAGLRLNAAGFWAFELPRPIPTFHSQEASA
jgi:hypothetical protein